MESVGTARRQVPRRRGLRTLLRRLRHAPERFLHASRRRAARAVLASRPFPRRILVVCQGNVCRSPLAAAALRRALGDPALRIESAGFVGADRPAPAEALAVAEVMGLDLSAHRSRPLMSDTVGTADLIIVMDGFQQRALCAGFHRLTQDVLVLGDLDPEPIETRGIEDPVAQGADVFERVYARIERCVAEIAKILTASRSQ